MDISISFAGGQKESIKLKRYGANLNGNITRGLRKCGQHGERSLKKSLKASNSTKFFAPARGRHLSSRTGALRRSITHQMGNAFVKIGPHEFGGSITVTPKMRAFLHFKGVHLRKSTTRIRIPARPWFEPVVDKERPQFVKLVEKEIYRDL